MKQKLDKNIYILTWPMLHFGLGHNSACFEAHFAFQEIRIFYPLCPGIINSDLIDLLFNRKGLNKHFFLFFLFLVAFGFGLGWFTVATGVVIARWGVIIGAWTVVGSATAFVLVHCWQLDLLWCFNIFSAYAIYFGLFIAIDFHCLWLLILHNIIYLLF